MEDKSKKSKKEEEEKVEKTQSTQTLNDDETPTPPPKEDVP